MNKLTLPIVIGRQYQRRDGKVITTVPCSNSTVAAVMHDTEPLPSGSVYLATGRYFSSGSESLADLVSDFNPPALTLPIVIGKRYVRRDGKIVTALKHPRPECAFANESEHSAACWRESGLIYHKGRPDKADLVADYIAPELPDADHVHTGVKPAGHPHAALMALYAQDAAETAEPWKRWQVNLDGHWTEPAGGVSFAATLRYRRKPKTICIGEFEVPEPLRVAPPMDTRYFFPAIGSLAGGASSAQNWDGESVDLAFLNRGMVHLTHEAAELHARALLSFTSIATRAPAA